MNIFKWIIAIVILFPVAAPAQDAFTIMQQVYDRDDGRTLISRIRLVTFPYAYQGGRVVATQQPRIKEMTYVTKDYGPGDKDHRSVSVLTAPKQEQGIGFLQFDYADSDKETDQWMYLSSLGKVRRIVSGNDHEPKIGSYFGSEFNYEDLESFKVSDYTYALMGEEIHRDKACWVVEMTPVPKKAMKSNYSRERVWVDKQRHLVLKSVRYSRSNREVKHIYFGDIRAIEGVLIAGKIVVDNVETRRRTLLSHENVTVNRPVEDDYLSLRTLTDKSYRQRKLKEYRQDK